MTILQIKGTQCCGKSAATDPFKDDQRVAFFDVLKFYERKQLIKSNGLMDWDKWNQAMLVLPDELHTFIKDTAHCKVQIVEHSSNRVVSRTLKDYDTITLEIKTPSQAEIIERAKKRNLRPERVAEFRQAYLKKYACHPSDALTVKEVMMIIKAKLSGIRVGIIGTAGRKEDGAKMNKDVYLAMVNDAKWQLERLKLTPADITLISGGAAWSDHIAISLYLLDLVSNLNLHFPAFWTGGMFAGDRTAETANLYHKQMSEKLGGNTLRGLDKAIVKGAIVKVTSGFKPRDLQIAQQSEVLIAYTWHNADHPKPKSGTAYTWKECNAYVKTHVPIMNLIE